MICTLSINQSFLYHFEHKYASSQSIRIHFVTEHKRDGSIRTLLIMIQGAQNFWAIGIGILKNFHLQ